MGLSDASGFVASFERGLTVIKAFGREGDRLSLTDVAKATGLTRATARRFLLTLTSIGYARMDGKYYELTPAVLELGYAFLSARGYWNTVTPYLAQVTDLLSESCSAGMLDDRDVVYVARSATQRRILAVQITVGTRLPAHATSMGQMLLAEIPPRALERFLSRTQLHGYTDRTLTDGKAFKRRLAQVREQKYAIVDQEYEMGLQSLAVPIRDPDGVAFAAINISRSINAKSIDLLETGLPVLRQAALQCEKAYQALYVSTIEASFRR